jgi:predicted nucleic acid-binding protein
MNIVDSSGWLEYFADGPNVTDYAEVLENSSDLLVPTLSLYEVFKVVLRQRGESEALHAVALMQEGKLIDLTSTIALHAAKLSNDLKIPMADSVMLATAREYDAVLWTQDSDFKGIEGVRYIAKK